MSEQTLQSTEKNIPDIRLVEIEGKTPRAEFKIDEMDYTYFGNTVSGHMWFQSFDGQTSRNFVVYQSKSGGSLRASQGIVGAVLSSTGRLIKGPEDSPTAQYTQDTQLHPVFDEVVGSLEDMSVFREFKLRDLEIEIGYQEAVSKDFEAMINLYGLGGWYTDSLLKVLRAGSLSCDDLQKAFNIPNGATYGDIYGAFNQYVEGLNEALETSGVMPDFSRVPDRIGVMHHEELGPVINEMFRHEFGGKSYEWHMARQKGGMAWIERIRLSDSEISPYGTDKDMVFSGILTSKPLEYAGQASGLPQFNEKLSHGLRYVDIRPTLQQFAPVQAYNEHASSRDDKYHY